jgi:hypothetical protein
MALDDTQDDDYLYYQLPFHALFGSSDPNSADGLGRATQTGASLGRATQTLQIHWVERPKAGASLGRATQTLQMDWVDRVRYSPKMMIKLIINEHLMRSLAKP